MMTKSYKLLAKGAGLLAGVMMVLGATAAQSQEPVRWKMQSWFPSRTPHAGTTGKDIETKIGRVSGGTLTIQFFEPKSLIPPSDCFEAVKKGTVDACWSTPAYWYEQEPAMALFSAAPFGMDWPGLLAWFYHHGGRQIYEKLYNKHNMHAIPCGGTLPEASGWFRKEIKSINDFKGLKIRFLPLGSLVLDKLGASTQLLAGGDVFPALLLGTIDAAEFATPAIDLQLGLYKGAKHYYFPGWHQPATIYDIMINLDRWKALSDQQQAMLEMVCGDNVRQAIAEGESMQPDALKEIEAKGVQIHRWPPETLKVIEKTWREVAAELSAKDTVFKEAYDSMQAWEAKYDRWRKLGYLDRN
jgi:TRAP-type mannitol/chloroaromatic compound transport system substrate-binding protein